MKKHSLITFWGKKLQKKPLKELSGDGTPLKEYPRPQLVRDSYLNLNGVWQYAITSLDEDKPVDSGKNIVVPFCPESRLSRVGHILKPKEVLWYFRSFVLDSPFIPMAGEKFENKISNLADARRNASPSANEEEWKKKKRVLLHFQAVDQYCQVWLNGVLVGNHRGGYLPFTLDVTKAVRRGENRLTVRVRDLTDMSFHSRGKQTLKPKGMFYTPVSGIWQSVWMECVQKDYIESLKIVPDLDKKTIYISAYDHERSTIKEKLWALLKKDGRTVEKAYADSKGIIRFCQKTWELWSPEHPFLYDLEIHHGKDVVKSYCAMRKISVKKDHKGISRIYLNDFPYFQNGVLDQGYWPDGIYTPPCEEAMIYDIKKMKELGFNMIRKHIKIENDRWYYHCDRLGMLVWQDMVNGGRKYNMIKVSYLPTVFPFITSRIKDNINYKWFGRQDEKGRKEYISELRETVKHLYNHPSIVAYVPFNEAWGQFEAAEVAALTKKLDKTRLVDHASGWWDQKAGDIKSLHIYFRSLKIKPEERPVVISEFGGYSLRVPNHVMGFKQFGYRKIRSLKELSHSLSALYKDVSDLKEKGLSGAVFTQLSDVESETNGILTYDRKVNKIPMENFFRL